jgi:hypothetical protein
MGRTRKEVIDGLAAALEAAGYSMRSASKTLGLNPGYLSEFMRETGYSPEVLPEDVREPLARLLGIDENFLRIRTAEGGIVKQYETSPVYSRRVGTVKDLGRDAEMRIDNILLELGRIKERLDRLEGRPLVSEKDKKPRPR